LFCCFKKKKKIKQGEFFFTDGSCYKGEIKEGQPVGQGNKEREKERENYSIPGFLHSLRKLISILNYLLLL